LAASKNDEISVEDNKNMKKKENLEQLMYLLGKYSRSNTPHKDYSIAVWRHRQIQAI